MPTVLGVPYWLLVVVLIAIAIRSLCGASTYHLCRSCGYDLRGNVTPRCPECGTRFVPQSSPAT